MEPRSLRSEGLYPRGRPVEPWLRELALAILAQAFRDATRQSRPSDRKDQNDWQEERNSGVVGWFPVLRRIEN